MLFVGVIAFAFGYFLAFGDELLEYRNLFQAAKHVILLALLGENLPGEEGMESGNFLFYIVTLLAVTFALVLIMMNIFIAVVSEVYASAVTESARRFTRNLDRDRFEKIYPKQSAQAESFLLNGYHQVLQREVDEQNDDEMPSNAADVHALLEEMNSIKAQLKKSLGKLDYLDRQGDRVEHESAKLPKSAQTFFNTTMASVEDRESKRVRDNHKMRFKGVSLS